MYLTSLPNSFGIDPWSSETTQQLPVGTVGYDAFGNMYRYGQQNASTASVAGKLYQSLPIDTNFVDMAVVVAAPIGARTISVTLGGSSTTAAQFTNGRLTVSVGTGIGQQALIVSHTVSTNGTTAVFTIAEPLAVNLTTSSKVSVIANPYGIGIVISPAARTGQIVGGSISVIPASSFGWYQTHGNGACICDATVPTAIGNGVSPSTTTAGDVTKAVTLIDRIGTFYILGVSTQIEPVFWNIN